MRILVVEDDPITRQILQRALLSQGYEVGTAADGKEALKVQTEFKAQLIISDWEMPEMDGLELCRAVRADRSRGYVYFILLTARDGTKSVIEGLDAGADDFLSKPFEPEELFVRIRAGKRVASLETREVAIFALAKLAESRDNDTGAHLERVRAYSRMLSEDMGTQEKFQGQITDEFVHRIFLTSPLHDIGKVGIPDRVLLKPGKLSDDEFNIMKTHTIIGGQTLEAALDQFPNADFLRMARDIAFTHHEKWDGSGYPNGLSEEAIPLCGRIVALADVYDALTSRRVYKDAFTHAKARQILMEGAGKHFDPDVTDSFVRIEDRFIDIRKAFGNEFRQAA